MHTKTVPIKGMHCRSCELLIEGELSSVPGICQVQVSHKRHQAIISHEGQLDQNAITAAIHKAGYTIGATEKLPWFSPRDEDYRDVVGAILALAGLYLVAYFLNLDKLFVTSSSHPTSLVMVLLVGITAGFSTCMALIGGLVLGVSARFAEKNPSASSLEKFKPHLLFNLGRIISYTILGGVIGLVGSFLQLSGFSLGLMTVAVALVMLTLGLQLTNLFPRLKHFSISLPGFISKALGIKTKAESEYSHTSAFFMGASTFFLPCGFTQAMQLYAMSTGNFAQGAAIMGMFAIGTAPGLLGIGGLTSVLRGVFAQKFFKFAGVVVVALSLFNFRNGLNLMGVTSLPFSDILAKANAPAILGTENENGIQIIRMDQTARGYSPNKFTVVVGKPVKWIITSKDPNSCASSIIASKINVRANLHPGENVFEFTPKEVGTISFSCSMGMYRGSIEVVAGGKVAAAQAALTVAQAVATPTPPPTGGSAGACGAGGCGCKMGKALPASPSQGGPSPAGSPIAAVVKANIQVIKTTYTSAEDIQPNQFEVKAGTPVRLDIDAKDDGSGCMSSIMVAGETEPVFLEGGKTISLEFTPQQAGDLPITCAMGVPRGVIKVT